MDGGKTAEHLLGWKVLEIPSESIQKIMREEGENPVLELRGGERICFLNQIPELSLEEAEFLHEVVGEFKAKENNEEALQSLSGVMDNWALGQGILVEEKQKEYLLEIMQLSCFDFGPMSFLLRDESIEEIAVIGIGSEKPVQVYDRTFGWLKTNLFYTQEKVLKDLVNKMAREIGRRISFQTPSINATLKNGSRLHAVFEPLAFKHPSITIRKFSAEPFTPANLLNFHAITAEALAFLELCMKTDASMIVGGNTGSGKTSTLNALLSFIPEDERIVMVEETPEIRLSHQHVVRLKTAEHLNVAMKELIVNSLRMRPDRMVVGEVRKKEEAEALLDTLLAGQGKGSYATFHCQSAKECILRMKSFGIPELDLASVDLIVVQRRWTDYSGGRKQDCRNIMEIAEVIPAGNGIELNELFEFNFSAKKLEKTGESRRMADKIRRSFSWDKEEMNLHLLQSTEKFQKQMEEDGSASELFVNVLEAEDVSEIN